MLGRATVLNNQQIDISHTLPPEGYTATFRLFKSEITNSQSIVKERVRLSLADKRHKLRRGLQAPSIMQEHGCCARTVRSILRGDRK